MVFVHEFRNGIRVVFHNSDGVFKHLTIAVILELSPLGNHLWAIFITLRRAYKLGYRDVMMETDNLEAFNVIKNYHIEVPAAF